jgi:hypothetical protein
MFQSMQEWLIFSFCSGGEISGKEGPSLTANDHTSEDTWPVYSESLHSLKKGLHSHLAPGALRGWRKVGQPARGTGLGGAASTAVLFSHSHFHL